MKFTLSSLKRHLDTNASLQEVCERLTAIGLEVEGVEDHAAALKPFIVAEVLTAEKHPDADRLRVCTVSSGKEKLQIVCGAPNARAGIKVVLARPGDVIPVTGEALKKGVIRGVESQGMMCSARELKLGDDHTGIIELPVDAPVGASYVEYAKLDDPVIEINLTPNRGDCAGVYGVARDLAAAGLGKLKVVDAKKIRGEEKSGIGIMLDFPKDKKHYCPLFAGRLIRNIKNGPSPEWLQKYLRDIGLRPISALVDITNFMTFEYSRPMHVFDADKVKGNLRVYVSKGGEKFDALNDKSYVLEADMTVINDDSGVLSLAGVVGGTSTGCDDKTVNVFVESATFDPVRTARTGRALQISSDARYRFERGVDPAFVVPGLEFATQLILDMCSVSDTVVSDIVVAGEEPKQVRVIEYDPRKCLQRIGVDVPEKEQERILVTLGFKVESKKGGMSVTVPSWRRDVEGAADLTEEIIRIKGFEHIEAVSLPNTSVVTTAAFDRDDVRLNQARRALAAQGLCEAVTWSFMPSSLAAYFGQINQELRLVNPMSAELDVMRSSIIGNLVLAAKRNADRGFADVGLFEVGPTYHSNKAEGQVMAATAVRAGNRSRNWAEPARAVDWLDAKADALAALAAAGAPMASVQVTADAPDWYHPGRSGVLRLGPTVLGYFGEIHPALLQEVDISGAVVGCELFIAAIPASRSNGTAKPLLKLEELQPVSRDFAFVVGAEVAVDKLIKAVKGADKNLIRDINVFDVYEGDKIDAGKKSVAISVTMQPTEKTLTDKDIEEISNRITAAVSKATGAVLRG